ncbi:MAG TPA: RNA pseudouridine synthase [Oceanospirillaceae bacterium]|nr:RNA pseudouridine synthase [Oceanospirillaceae bacterium]
MHRQCTQSLPILYADAALVLVNKPSGLLSVPGRDPANYDSVYSRLLARFGEIHVVHRLDMDTSGVMILARHKDALRHLSRQFQQRTTRKHYLAWVDGVMEQAQASVNLPLRCDWPNRPKQMVDMIQGKPSLTEYEVLRFDEAKQASLVRLTPITGRSHQLRVHMAALGNPILGCRFYAHEQVQEKATRLQLHAEYLQVLHPDSNLPLSQRVVADFVSREYQKDCFATLAMTNG